MSDDTFRRLGKWVTYDHLSSVIESNLLRPFDDEDDGNDEDDEDDEDEEDEDDEYD